MTSKHHIIVSAENSPYMAWQCKLIHYSCLSRLRRPPIIFVHASGPDWHPDFLQIVRAGGVVRTAPSYRVTGGGRDYAPRNAPGTLLEAAGIFEGDDQFLVLCDPDMIFLRGPDFPAGLAAEAADYLDYDHPDVLAAAGRLGVSLAAGGRKEELCCGAPYIIPVTGARPLAQQWLAAIDAFASDLWEVSMYAFGLAVMRLGLEMTLTRLTASNHSSFDPPRAEILHYCYGDEAWSKRQYWDAARAAEVWEPTAAAPRGTVLAEIQAQIAEAAEFYRGPRGLIDTPRRAPDRAAWAEGA